MSDEQFMEVFIACLLIAPSLTFLLHIFLTLLGNSFWKKVAVKNKNIRRQVDDLEKKGDFAYQIYFLTGLVILYVVLVAVKFLI